MKNELLTLLAMAFFLTTVSSCVEDRGANPFDGTAYTVSQWPQVESFFPISAKAGEEITISGKNFSSVTSITFGNVEAASFEIISDTEIRAIVAEGSHSGAIAVTNHKGTKSIRGFSFIAPAVGPDANLALGSNVTASNEDFTPPSNVVAGNIDVYWAPDKGITEGQWDSWILLELPQKSDINEVIVKWFHNDVFSANDPKSFEVQVSSDGSFFETVGSFSTEMNFFHEATGSYEYNAKFSKVTGITFVRIVINQSVWQPMLAEVEVYCREGVVVTNKALGSVVTASNEDFTPPENVVDDNVDAYWAPAKGITEGQWDSWIQLELPEASEINRIIIRWFHNDVFSSNDPSSYEVQISNDGTVFETVGTVSTASNFLHETHCDGYDHTVDFVNRSSVRYVKIVINASVWQPMLAEVEAYSIESKDNKALGSVVSASNEEFTPPSNVVSGDTNVYWAPAKGISEGQWDSWIKLELPSSTSVGRIAVKWFHNDVFSSNDPKSYDLQLSTDGSSFLSVGEFSSTENFIHETHPDNYVQIAGFQTKSDIRFVRLVIKESVWQPMLAEIEVYSL